MRSVLRNVSLAGHWRGTNILRTGSIVSGVVINTICRGKSSMPFQTIGFAKGGTMNVPSWSGYIVHAGWVALIGTWLFYLIRRKNG